MLAIKLILFFIALIVTALYAVNLALAAKVPSLPEADSAHYKKARFHNTTPTPNMPFLKTVALWIRFFTEKKVNTTPDVEIPVRPLSKIALAALSHNELHIIKLGHSSVLLKVYGEYWLLDPVFSERASPFSFAGPKRFHQPPIALRDLPTIDKVLISHNHYDHLDKSSITILANKTREFFVPKGVDGDLKKWGVESSKITVFDWWQERQTKQGMVVFTPSQHFSGRGLSDGNRTLWGSWVIKTPQQNLYFSGDSGYFSGFKEIGDRYGPFDLTMIETGAYDKDWASIHMTPEESVQTHLDLKGKVMVPIHNGTFDLAFHAWYDPFNRVVAEAERRAVALSTPEFGQIFTITDAPIENPWWRVSS